MRIKHLLGGLAIIACISASPVAARKQSEDAQLQALLAAMMSGRSAMQGAELEAAIAKADQTPLGSASNPVRVGMPTGQRAYLDRLRCSDGKAPGYYRAGNVGAGVFGNIVDLYVMTCGEAEPKDAKIYMDMYHTGHVEDRAVPGFTIAG